jgi:hypothetical protein
MHQKEYVECPRPISSKTITSAAEARKGYWLHRKLETIKLALWPLPMKSPQKARKREMSKQAMREETERLVKEALERKILTVKQGKTRIDSKCRKCGALNRVSAAQGQVRVPYMCKDCGEKQRTF